MPPCLDVYALTRRRDRSCLDGFLARYVDVDRSRDRGGEELAVLPLGWSASEDDLPLREWDSIPLATLDDVIDFGLARPCRAFRVYLRSVDPWKGVILGFTTDCRLVVGVSVDDPLGLPGPRNDAIRLLWDLMEEVEGEHGWVAAETPPPLDPAREPPWEASDIVASTQT